ncbi:MAG: sugar phosphate isomerase/epimerase family protein [Phycisphaerales bacterium]|jgi:sugar phosphate isomerase/epimerase|nr:sugar phosphate isomerase/epimerase [Phycisphaeraceae bacterium]
MIKVAMSTVACPEWTLETIAQAAQSWGYHAVELRTFGDASRSFACDPALTNPEKIRRWFGDRGLTVASLATGLGFGEAITPPVIGNVITDSEVSVRAAKRAIDLAISLECPLVRVFGFELPTREKRSLGVARVADRLGRVIDHAHRTGVSVMIENAGSFMSVQSLMDVVREVNSPLLGVCANIANSFVADEGGESAIAAAGTSLMALRVKDLARGSDGVMKPAALGAGVVPFAPSVAMAAARVSGGGVSGGAMPVIFEYDRAWLPGLASAESVLPAACEAIVRAAGAQAAAGAPSRTPMARA